MVKPGLDLPLESDHKVDFGLSGNVEVTSLPCLPLESDLLLLLREVLLHILVRPLKDDLALGLLVLGLVSGHPEQLVIIGGHEGSAPKDGILQAA